MTPERMAELKDLLDFAAEQRVHAIEVTLLQETLQEIERLQAELADCQPWTPKLLRQYVEDTSDGFECLPNCDSHGHEELCPVTNVVQAFRLLRERLEQAKERERQLQDQNMRVGGDYFRERTRREGLEFVYAQLRAEINDVTCDGHHHILKEENGRLREALTRITSFSCGGVVPLTEDDAYGMHRIAEAALAVPPAKEKP